MGDLKDHLARLGLGQYHEVFATEGFDTWGTVVDITESDLNHLGVQLRHRRTLQGAIAESRRKLLDRPSASALRSASLSKGSGTRVKRKYRRRPKLDQHAPQRPPSGYVIFSNETRHLLKDRNLSFVESAKVIGEKWQALSTEKHDSYERLADGAKESYFAELAEYKKTSQFEAHRKHLEARDAAPPEENKRCKLEAGTILTTRIIDCDPHKHALNMGSDSVQPETATSGGQRVGLSLPLGTTRLFASPWSSKPALDIMHPPEPLHEHGYSIPMSVPSRSATLQGEASFKTLSSHPRQDIRVPIKAKSPYYRLPPFATLFSYPYSAEYQTPIGVPPRLSRCKSTHSANRELKTGFMNKQQELREVVEAECDRYRLIRF